MTGGPPLPGRAAHRHPVIVDDGELRELVPRVLSVLVRRGADFATAEDAVQEALIRALSVWGDELPADPTGWLITVAWRAFLDMTRSDAARRDRELRFDTEPPAGAIPSADDTLRLYFLCAHPDLTSSSAVALTLRAVGGLTTRQIAEAYLVPESTMAQRISRAKRTVSQAGLDRPSDDRRAPCPRAARQGNRLGPDRGVVRRAPPVRRHSDRPAQPCGRARRGRRRTGRTGSTGRRRRTRPAAHGGRRVSQREERRAR